MFNDLLLKLTQIERVNHCAHRNVKNSPRSDLPVQILVQSLRFPYAWSIVPNPCVCVMLCDVRWPLGLWPRKSQNAGACLKVLACVRVQRWQVLTSYVPQTQARKQGILTMGNLELIYIFFVFVHAMCFHWKFMLWCIPNPDFCRVQPCRFLAWRHSCLRKTYAF